MNQSILHIALVVRDYDEAIDFYCNKLNFKLIDDTYQPEQDKRWVVVSPPSAGGTNLLLAQASSSEQEKFIGNQSGGRVFLFLQTDDFERDFRAMNEAGIRFIREPKVEAYGTVAVFEDLYGNSWDLFEPVTQEDHLATIESLERRLLEPQVRTSRQELDELIAESFVEFGSSGRVWTKSEIIDELVDGPGSTIEIDSVQPRYIGEDTILITYRSRRVGEGSGVEALRSSIWRQLGDRWQLIFHQGTKPDGNFEGE